MKALEQEFRGQVKCIYIDPPFNTGEDFDNYSDGMEHSSWLSMMRDRIVLLNQLLCEDGAIFIHIDDNELGYLIVLLDEVFGRNNRVAVVSFKQGSATGHKSINPGVVNTTNFVLIYAKNKSIWKPCRVFTARAARDKRYNQFIDNYESGISGWRFVSLLSAFSAAVGIEQKSLKKELGGDFEEKLYEFISENSARVVRLARPDYKAVSAEARRLIDESKSRRGEVLLLKRESHSDMFFLNGERVLFYSDKLKLIDGNNVAGEPLTSLWDDILSNNLHNEGGVEFPKGKKPEALIKRCLEMATVPGDLVLDSFAGSGTTGAVAHKMGRRWIMVELGEHCHTHIVPRLRKVIDGDDPGGVTSATGWKGGGGFRYYRLAPSLLSEDAFGNRIINPEYRPEMLAEAVCKLMGYTYAPSEQHYWQHGRASEHDFLYVTTTALGHAQLRTLSEEVGPERTLLVCCKAFRANADAFDNLTIQKIPKTVLDRCEWGRDDYSLRIAELPSLPEQEVPPPPRARSTRGASSTAVGTSDLFGEDNA
ncbi:site-specific DNA-methyltransferase [Xanthomonas campestris pv. campestris]|nr:site-specific DNA-methyltransferase [Xanthomonas campestris pv. campestris]